MAAAPTDELSCYLLPGRPPSGFPYLDLYNKTFVYWRDFWNDVLSGLKSDKPLLIDDFVRQDRIVALVHGGEVVAVHLYTYFDLQQLSAREHSYCTRYYPEAFFTTLAQRQVHRVMSLEYFSVSPEWRAAKAGLSLGAVMIGLGLKVAEALGAQAAIAPARRDNVVLKLVHDQGATSVVPNVVIHNAPCDLIAFFPGESHPASDPKVNALIERFWAEHTDTTSSNRDLRVAA